MRVSVFGIGYVGAVSSACLAEMGHRVIGVDISHDKVGLLGRGLSPIVERDVDVLISTAHARGQLQATANVAEAIAETEISFVSVGTPNMPNGRISLHAVEAVVAEIGSAIAGKDHPHDVVMRSTVPPGTAEEVLVPLLEKHSGRTLGNGLRYYSNPEFLREGTAVGDFHTPPFTLVGAPANDEATSLRELYAPIAAPFHVVPYRVAESVKLISNAYHAIKLAFANEVGSVLAAHGVDAREAFRLFCEDRILNISPAYLRPGYAFGGSCLPKDLRGLLALADAKTVSTPLLAQVLPSNNAIVDRVFREIAECGRQPVSLFGLAFKQGTDDLRESPFVLLAERLIGKGWPIRIFDRFVSVATLVGSNRRYIDQEIPHLERLLTSDPAEALAGSRLAVVGHVGKEDLPALLQALDGHKVLDLVGIPQLRERAGSNYRGLCW